MEEHLFQQLFYILPRSRAQVLLQATPRNRILPSNYLLRQRAKLHQKKGYRLNLSSVVFLSNDALVSTEEKAALTQQSVNTEPHASMQLSPMIILFLQIIDEPFSMQYLPMLTFPFSPTTKDARS